MCWRCDRLCIDECCFLMPLTHTAIWFTALLNVACYCLDPHTTTWVTVVSDYTLFFCLIIITITVPYTMTKVNCPITPMTIISASACHYATFSISFNETSKIRSSRRIHYHGQVCVPRVIYTYIHIYINIYIYISSSSPDLTYLYLNYQYWP